jgi:hypothetical protein
MARHLATFLLTCAVTGVVVGAIARGSIVFAAPLVVLALVAIVLAGRLKTAAVSPPVSVSVSVSPPATHVASACPKCGGAIDWVATFQAAWCARCGRVR